MKPGRLTKRDEALLEGRYKKEFTARYSDLERRVRALHKRNADPELVLENFNEALEVLSETARPVPPKRDPTSRWAAKSDAIDDYLLQSERRAALRRMAAFIAAECEDAEVKVRQRQFEILRLLLDQDPIDEYQSDLADKLDRVGFSKQVAQKVSDDQLADFVSHVSTAAEARKPGATHALTPGNADQRQEWRKLLKAPPLVSVTREERDPSDPLLIKLNEAGLPPFSMIESYLGNSRYTQAFHSAEPKEKSKIALKVLADWVRKQHYQTRPSDEQRRLWAAMLGVKYGFAQELVKRAVPVPSPWLANEVVILRPRSS